VAARGAGGGGERAPVQVGLDAGDALADGPAVDGLAGLVVGKVNAAAPGDVRRLDALVAAHTADVTYPVLTQVDLGHTDPRLILPLGVRATLDAAGDRFSPDEPAVCARR
jgi:muramoyltetrapeptide carboxypeptidase